MKLEWVRKPSLIGTSDFYQTAFRQFYNELYSAVNETLCQQHISTTEILGRVNADKDSYCIAIENESYGDSLGDFPQEATVRSPSGRISEPARF